MKQAGSLNVAHHRPVRTQLITLAVAFAALAAFGIVATSACGGHGSPVSPTLASRRSTNAVSGPQSVAVLSVSPASGSIDGGTEVTISGAEFAEGATVSFGDVPAPRAVVVGSETIIATTPAHAEGPVDVVVVNPDGDSVRIAGGYTYRSDAPPTPSTAPAIRSVMPSSGPTTGGTEIIISGSGFVEGATVRLGQLMAPQVIVASDTAIMAITPVQAEGTVDVVVTNPDGQSGTLAGGFTFMAEHPQPLATITITSSGVEPRDLEVAVGSRVLFINDDSRPHTMNSDPHPLHTDCPEINRVGLLQPGQRRETTPFQTPRTCGYHDHNQSTNQALRGRIVIR